MTDTVLDLLSGHPDGAPVIGGLDRRWLTYGDLQYLAAHTRIILAEQGIGAGDRVAIVLPNGPTMATAFISIATAATTAPLNPAYREEEFRFYLEDLKAKALVVADGDDSPAIGARAS